MKNPSIHKRFSCLALTIICACAPTVSADALLAWGNNSYGQVGNGTGGPSVSVITAPTPVNGMSQGVTSIGAGTNHSLAVKDGLVYAWGHNGYGQLGDGTTTGRHLPQLVPNIGNGVTAASGGTGHSLIIKDGAAIAWGTEFNSVLGNGTSGPTSAISGPVPVTGLGTGVTAISSNPGNNMALRDGAVYAWGRGYLGNGPNGVSTTPVVVSALSSGVTAVSTGGLHALAVRNGSLFAWGSNRGGQLGNNTFGASHDSEVPVAVDWMQSGVTAVAAGLDHSLAIKDGNVYVWGKMDNTFSPTLDTQPVLALDQKADFVDVAAAIYSSYALSSDGSLWVWGENDNGQLGLGHTTNLYPQHDANGWTIPAQQLMPPVGYRYTDITAPSYGRHVLALVAPRTQYGDANLDNTVNFDDLLALAQHYGTAAGATWTDGDFNLDNAVDFSDLLTLAQHYGTSSALIVENASPNFAHDWALALTLVPEPASMVAVLTGVSVFIARRRR